ncbi:MAG: transcriptional regulator [Deltaproteobacteria bacterium]|nr:transcriptional regulator [Deltaproteobacteria bacterium]
MVRWLVLVVVAFVLYKLIANEMRKRSEDTNRAKGAKEPTGDMVKDPVCGSYVDVASSVSVRDGEKVHRFCSYECRDAFLEQLRMAGRTLPGKPHAESADHAPKD